MMPRKETSLEGSVPPSSSPSSSGTLPSSHPLPFPLPSATSQHNQSAEEILQEKNILIVGASATGFEVAKNVSPPQLRP